jgi:phosphatidylserine decarboxylase
MTIHDPQGSFEALSRWANATQPQIRLSKSKGGITVLSGDSIITRIFSFFRSSIEASRYSGLKEVMSSLIERVKDKTKAAQERSPEERTAEIQAISHIFQKIRSEYISLAAEPESLVTMRKKNDLLEAFTLGLQEEGKEESLAQIFSEHAVTPLKRITSLEVLAQIDKVAKVSKKPLEQARTFDEKCIMLVEYQKIQAAVQALVSETPPGTQLSGEQLAQKLKGISQLENAPMGKMIDLLYAHRYVGRETINRITTALMGWKYNSPKKIEDVQATLKYFKKLNIKLETDIGGELYSFSEVFGYDIATPKTYNESFGRAIVPKMLEKMLETYRQKQAEVRSVLHDDTAQVICSNSFSRTTVHEVGQGRVHERFNITGKVLVDSEENVEAASRESSYTGQFQFSVAAMLGEGIKPMAAPVDSLGQQDRQLLTHLTSFVDDNDTLLVVQRLSPEDIHHFYQTADTTILGRAEFCQALIDELSKKENLDPIEQKHLADLISMKSEYEALARSQPEIRERSTINIEGVMQSSVSRKALYKESEILAQNDRKVMMCRNNDGSIVVHVFIGATGVNKVAVAAMPGKSLAGADLGDMEWGNEKKDSTWIKAKPTLFQRIVHAVASFFGKKDLPAPPPADPWVDLAKVDVSEDEVSFGAASSTVISLYLKKDYSLEPNVEAFFQTAVFQGKKSKPGEVRALEMRSGVGDVLATPVLFQTITLMNHLKVTRPGKTPYECFCAFKEAMKGKEAKTGVEKLWESIFKQVGDSSSLEEAREKLTSRDDLYQFDRLIAFLQTPPSSS